jgi:hypothetical protein
MATIRRLSEVRRAYKAGVEDAHLNVAVLMTDDDVGEQHGEQYVQDYWRGVSDTEQLISLGIIARGEQA